MSPGQLKMAQGMEKSQPGRVHYLLSLHISLPEILMSSSKQQKQKGLRAIP